MARWARNTTVKFIGASLTIRDDANVMKHAARVFEQMYYRGQNLAPVLDQQRGRMQTQARYQFEHEGWPTKWQALNPHYARWKERHYPGKTMMRRSDRLYDSLVSETPDSIWRVTPHSIQYGTRVPYWERHQYGDPPGLPARPTVALDYYTLSFIGDDIVSYVIANQKVSGTVGQRDTVIQSAGVQGSLIKRMLGAASKYISFRRGK